MNKVNLHYDTIVIGGGQAGLTTGYYLKQTGRDFMILDAGARIGDSWRKRWDSLRLFTPARYNGLVGMPFPAPAHNFPTKDEMADYLKAYAEHFDLPVRLNVRVDSLKREGDCFVITAGELRFEANNVVVAMSTFQKPRIPSFAPMLDPNIVQMHSSEYRNPSQLQDGGVLVVGAGNSGAEIAMEVVHNHPTWLAGRDTGHVPFRIEGFAARVLLVRLVLRVLFHRILTVNTPMGRKARPKMISKGTLLVRVKPQDMMDAGIKRTPRVIGVENGLPVLEDKRTVDVANVIWCTGFKPGFSWIDLPIHGDIEPEHASGVVASEPGLYFVGLHFLHAVSSAQIHGVSRDAERIVQQLASRPIHKPEPEAVVQQQRSPSFS